MTKKVNVKTGKSTRQHGSTTNAKPKNGARSTTGKGVENRPFK